MPTFPLVLHSAYYNAGFFNVRVEHDRYLPEGEGPIELQLAGPERKIEGRVDRRANSNATSRVRGGVELRDWFKAHFQLSETIKVDVMPGRVLRLSRWPTTR